MSRAVVAIMYGIEDEGAYNVKRKADGDDQIARMVDILDFRDMNHIASY